MKLKSDIRLTFAVLASYTLLIAFVSCKKTEAPSTTVELLSFGPAGATHGEQIRFIGNNLDKVTAIDLTGASVASSAFIEQTTELIVITVPIDAEHGPVTLKTPTGDIVSKSPLNLEVPVEISSITETVKPGATITIVGEYLNWISAVTFEGGAIMETFESQSRTELVVRVPLEAKTGPLVFSCGGTEPIELESEEPLTVILPTISALTPIPVRHGSELTITGSDLDLVEGVTFTGLDEAVTEFVSQSETQLVITVPNGANNGNIAVMSFSGVSVASEEALAVVLPTVTAFNPNPVARGAELTIVGTELNLVKGVLFKGTDNAITEFIKQSDTELVLAVPETTNKGTVTLVTHPLIDVESTISLNIVGDLPPLAPLGYAIYADAIVNSWGDWGWNGTVDFNNTENVRDGSMTIKKGYDGTYGGLRFGGGSVSTLPYTEIVFSIFGTPGTGGLKINVIANEQWGAPHTITIVEGEWVEFKLSKADLGISDELKDLIFQDQGWSGTIYVDHVGLR
ncbi:hypothetical protein GCM10007415_17460 [Parapedobacter pyrenivorans]|uniref:IPT/TIG domain-containing protein n=1 Tax=Parapedobacter pyrenivorans TaxID=1305674 RepID=A0A917HNT9_9SPHI|nr:IPT/TIG domain-containing protein [Parapedobacter pyrenivorans]GGG84713.1 hypothetical protein GCM10007415_17460 [Parapedobacter pyrenivorans]